MEGKWNLDKLYTGFDSEKFKNDIEKLIKKIDGYKEFADSLINSNDDIVKRLEAYINDKIEISYLAGDLFNYTNLILSVDTTNETGDRKSVV